MPWRRSGRRGRRAPSRTAPAAAARGARRRRRRSRWLGRRGPDRRPWRRGRVVGVEVVGELGAAVGLGAGDVRGVGQPGGGVGGAGLGEGAVALALGDQPGLELVVLARVLARSAVGVSRTSRGVSDQVGVSATGRISASERATAAGIGCPDPGRCASLAMPSFKHRPPTVGSENHAQPRGLWITLLRSFGGFETGASATSSTTGLRLISGRASAGGVAEPAVVRRRNTPDEACGQGSAGAPRAG